MTKREQINARIVDDADLLTYSLANHDTREMDTWGGNLLAPDEEGYTRGHRLVFILAGTTVWSCGGPEEGGWYYDHFQESFRVEASVNSEDELVTVLAKVDELLTLVQGPSYTQIRIGVDDYPHFQRPRYE